MNHANEDVEGTKNLINAGSEITGSVMGAVIGCLFGGPAGAVIGGASTPLLNRGLIKIGNDIAERFLSEREKTRIGGAIAYAIIAYEKNLAEGKKIRDDGFFEKPSMGHAACAEIPFVERPIAEEIIEGVLLASKKEYEERKIPFLGNLLANIAFYSEVNRAQANLLIKLAENLSFRQFCILAVFAQPDKFALIDGSYRDRHMFILGAERLSLLQEIFELGSQGMLTCGTIMLEMADVDPKKMKLQGTAISLYRLMELWKIDSHELDSIVSLLQ
jgi:hypothetical protein